MKRILFCVVAVFNLLLSQSHTDSLKAYYPFSGNADDASGNFINGTVNGAVLITDRYDAGENAYSFNGSSAWIDLGDNDILNPHLADISVSAWIKTTQQIAGTGARIYSKGTSGGSQPGYDIMLYPNQGGKAAFIFGIGGHEHIVFSNAPVNDGEWHLITGVADRDGNAHLYIDRVKQTSEIDISVHSATDLAANTYNASMGVSYSYNGTPGILNEYFNGNIDEVRVYKRMLSQQDIDQLYANYLPPDNFTAAAEHMSNNLSWDTSEYERLEKVRIFRNGAFLDEVMINGPEDSLYSDTDLIPDSTNYYFITSVDTLGNESIKSEEIGLTTVFIPFTETDAGLSPVGAGTVKWGDYDNDGDLDLIAAGIQQGSYPYYPLTKIYRNDDSVFTDISATVSDLGRSSADWGDYDNDGDIDLLLTGHSYAPGLTPRTVVYLNEEGNFIDINAGLPGIQWGQGVWGDYDNDGDLDILINGQIGSGMYLARIYRNESGVFTDINAGMTGGWGATADWIDYDNDGDLDIMLTGYSGSGGFSRIYENIDGVFTDINSGITDVYYSSTAWGDYDSDGDMDLLISGNTDSGYITKLYRNDSGVFTDTAAGLPGVTYGSVSWGDYDNDGDLDIFLTGDTGSGNISRIYRNDGNDAFSNTDAGLTGIVASSAEWGDYDADGDLDIVVMGTTGSEFITKIYRNNCLTANSVPSQPSNLEFTQDNGLSFSFDPGSDAETPSAGLTYNIDINIGDGTVKSASSDLITGYRMVPKQGNIGECMSWTLNAEPPEDAIPQQLFAMTWKVQAVDNCFAGSVFATKNDTIMNRELVTVPRETMVATDALTWEYYMPADSVAGYTVQLSGDSLFIDPFGFFMPSSKDNKTVYIGIDLESLGVTDSLENNGRYFWRVKPEHVSPVENPTGFKKVPDSFIYDPIYSAPSPVSITVEGNYITLSWGTGKEGEKSMLYNIYSSDDPSAVFPSGWTLVNSVTGTSYLLNSTERKKFYCVTAAGSVK